MLNIHIRMYTPGTQTPQNFSCTNGTGQTEGARSPTLALLLDGVVLVPAPMFSVSCCKRRGVGPRAVHQCQCPRGLRGFAALPLPLWRPRGTAIGGALLQQTKACKAIFGTKPRLNLDPLALPTTATLQHCNTATLQHCNTATLQHCNTATLQHCNTATLQHCNTALGTALFLGTQGKGCRQLRYASQGVLSI